MVTPKAKILLLDDDRSALDTLSNGLKQAGYDVLAAHSGDDAILLAREQRPDLALLDVRMGGKGSFDVAAYLRDYCAVPFIFLTQSTDDATAAQIKAMGALGCVSKPLDMALVVALVDEAIAETAEQRSEAERTLSMPSEDALASTSVAIAVGILMHRYSLGRKQALDRLKRLAELRSIQEHAERLIDAVELLSVPAPPPQMSPAPPTPS